MQTPNESVRRLLSRKEVLSRIPLTYATIWQMMRAGTFPRAIAVGDRTFWHESAIEAWIATQPLRKLKGDADGVEFSKRDATSNPGRYHKSSKAMEDAS
jgi:predicted DNA-binding transcriptional regulator AlpA